MDATKHDKVGPWDCKDSSMITIKTIQKVKSKVVLFNTAKIINSWVKHSGLASNRMTAWLRLCWTSYHSFGVLISVHFIHETSPEYFNIWKTFKINLYTPCFFVCSHRVYQNNFCCVRCEIFIQTSWYILISKNQAPKILYLKHHA